jgi:rare lipoprotein A
MNLKTKSQWQIAKPIIIVSFITMMISACSTTKPSGQKYDQEHDSAPQGKTDWSKIVHVKPQYEPKSKYGNPVSYEQNGRKYVLLASAKGHKERGTASWYGTKFDGRRTSSGETYDMMKMTAAHKTLPIPAYAKVTNLENGKQVIVKINDRGPFAKGRIIDLSYAAAYKIGMTEKGTARVEVETITFDREDSPVQSANYASTIQPVTALPNDNAKAKKPLDKKRYVQVGAYSNHKTAQKLAKVLDREIRLPVKITSINRKGRKLYRVRIGPVPTEALARELIDTLDIKELGKPKIVYQ